MVRQGVAAHPGDSGATRGQTDPQGHQAVLPDLGPALLHGGECRLDGPLDQLARPVLHPVHRRLTRLQAALQQGRARVLRGCGSFIFWPLLLFDA